MLCIQGTAMNSELICAIELRRRCAAFSIDEYSRLQQPRAQRNLLPQKYRMIIVLQHPRQSVGRS